MRDPLRRSIAPALFAVCASWVVVAAAASAQFQQFTPPTALVQQVESRAEAAVERAETARWRIGRLRLSPSVGLRDVAYYDNVFNAADGQGTATSDFRASAEAGLQAFSYLGPKTLFTVFARPTYNYWHEQEQLRELDVSYGAGLFGLFNRLTFDLTAQRVEEERLLNDELRVPTQIERDEARFEWSVDLRGPLALFGGASTASVGHPLGAAAGGPAVDLSPLDRDETIVSAGIEYSLANGLRIGVGAQATESDFDVDPDGRSSESSGPLVRIGFEGNRAVLDLSVVDAELETVNPDVAPSDDLTGRARAQFEVGNRSALTLFGSQQVVYSALATDAVFASRISGAQLGWQLRSEIRVGILGSTGTNTYSGAGDLGGRQDDVRQYGIQVTIPLRGDLRFDLGAFDTEIDSNRAEFDRSFTTVRLGVSLPRVGFLD